MASAVRALADEILAASGLRSGNSGGVDKGFVEIYPKQNRVEEGKLGNLIALPLARASLYLNPEAFQPIETGDFTPPKLEDLFNADIPSSYVDRTRKILPKRLRERIHTDDAETVTSALKYLEADSFDDWVKGGLAIKNHFGEEGFDIFHEWSKSSRKYQSEEDCRDRWDSLNPSGELSIGTIFHHAKERGWNGPKNSIIRSMNARFGIFIHGTSTQIIQKHEPQTSGKVFDALGVQQFHDLLRLEFRLTEDDKRVQVSSHWFGHKDAARYTELVFDPSLPPGDNGSAWNMWQGFAYDPVPGDWSRLREHIFENICGADSELSEWMLNWMAFGVQHPAQLIGTAPVLLGPPGVGKSFLAARYGALWGVHSTTITNAAHVSGRFNAHMIGKRFVFIDEGIFGGSRKEAGVIKTRVTEEYTLLEQKNIDSVLMRNHTIYMIASNENSVVPADLGDRRWMVIDVGTKRAEDHPYFGAIANEMNNGGYQAMLHDLLKRDLMRGPDPRKTIKTDALAWQIIEAQPPYVQFIFRLLDVGHLPQSGFCGNVRSTTIKALHAEFLAQHRESRFVNDSALSRHFRKFIPEIRSDQNGSYQIRPGESERSTRCDFPPLRQARLSFERKLGQKMPWSNDMSEWSSDPMDEIPI